MARRAKGEIDSRPVKPETPGLRTTVGSHRGAYIHMCHLNFFLENLLLIMENLVETCNPKIHKNDP